MNQNSDKMMDIKNIVLRFGGVVAIQNISFDIFKGEIRAIIGPNGAGKSSMLNVINGFYHPQEGEVWFRGQKRKSMKPYQIAHQGIARTFQNIALFKGMTALDNIMTGRFTHMKKSIFSQMIWEGGASKEEYENREVVEKVIDFLEIQHIRKTPVGALPYGLQKRVELGRALAAEPELLLLDEPMAGAGPEESQRMTQIIERLRGQMAILLIEHDMDAVFRLADRITVLVEGEVIASGTADEISNSAAVQNAYLGSE